MYERTTSTTSLNTSERGASFSNYNSKSSYGSANPSPRTPRKMSNSSYNISTPKEEEEEVSVL